MQLVRKLSLVTFFIASISAINAHALSVKNGPMLTHTTMHSVQIWLQLDSQGSAKIEYWKKDQPDTKWESESVEAIDPNGYVVKLLAKEGIEPGEQYGYRVLIGEDEIPYIVTAKESTEPLALSFQAKPRWRWIPDTNSRARHSAFDFRIALGSCAYINEPGADREGGKPYGSDYQIFESIHHANPDLMLWLGDNVYYRENDYENREGMIHRWTHDRSIPELRPLLANTIHYATWDDHDYGPNDIGSSYWLKEEATEVFNLMWGNPSSGLPELPGLFTFVNWGDVNIYFLDNRTYQSTFTVDEFGTKKTLLGKKQIDWLVNHLAWAQSQSSNNSKSYPARFNLIVLGSQVLNESGTAGSMRSYSEEWMYLMDRITAEQIRGVVFLTGDVHFGEVNRVEHSWKESTSTIYEVTSSPLTAGPWKGYDTNPARYDIFPGEMDRVGQRNFVTLDFQGSLNDRKMIIRYWDSDGNLLNQAPDSPPGTPTPASIIEAF